MAITITTAVVGGNEDQWGSITNTALNTIVDAINGTSGTTAPNLSTLTINGTNVTSTAAELNKLDGFTGTFEDLNYAKDLRSTGVTSTEYGYLDTVSSNIQTQLNAKQATITGAATTIDTENLTANRALISNGSGKVAASSSITTTELGYLNGVTSNIQTQLNAKGAPITGAATTIDTENLTASRALVSNGSGKVAVSAVSSTELGHLDNVTSNIQTQLNGKLSTSGGTVSGNFTATGNVTGDHMFVGDAISLTSYSTNWKIDVDGSGNLLFIYGSATRMKLDASGNLSVEGNVTAYASL